MRVTLAVLATSPAQRKTLKGGTKRDGVRDGSIRPLDERALSMAMFDAFNGLARWYDKRGAMSLAAIVEQHLSVFLYGIAPRREVQEENPS
jgi:hypothetical protein